MEKLILPRKDGWQRMPFLKRTRWLPIELKQVHMTMALMTLCKA